ncbi:DNA polymerase beta domain protein region [[Leptolyngbya] sp. PCC 7376]|uniref:nucleotidyltransferase domain-containing protein n=1 Tax=[Leptolyngbya] sp. PCC 7376 TaxID=111781 RepID=UPI00029F22F3|nr:nucleotidyltransferase domain-containing protein [[Leptolyngbya] sp. PCC 7376]AFY37344.1 DNA polymerase beta domain protein region [[Leptolyngbya] sp. PCC 7376]
MNLEEKRAIVKITTQKLKEYLQDLYQDNLDRVILFGSQARGDAKFYSDIDVAIVLKNDFDFDAEIEKTSQFVADLCLDYDVLINRLFMSTGYYHTHQSALTRNLQQEGILL